MTGFGEGHRQRDGLAVTAEVRTINSRYFKLSVRAPEGYTSLEPQIEAVFRDRVHRGTVHVNLRIDRESTADDFKVNAAVLSAYRRQLVELSVELGLSERPSLESLLELPGVVNEETAWHIDAEGDWPVIREALEDALVQLSGMRTREGEAMAADLRSNCELLGRELDAIESRAPLVVEAYAKRLTDRLNKLLAEHQVKVETADIVREVGVFAERSDIAEEVVRLNSHLQQFDQIMNSGESVGRKLEFVTQEMYRETNTIGSKANDAEIARHVVEIKAAIERMREMIQNVE